MNIQTFVQKTSNLHAENRLLKFTVVCLAIAVVISGFFSYAALRYQRVVILPPVVDRRIVISGNDVGEDYVRLFTRYAMNLLNSYTPGTARGQFNELLALASPAFYPNFQKTLESLVDTITKLNLTSMYYPQAIVIDEGKRTITVTGAQKRFAGLASVEDGKKQYLINYILSDGRFFIDGITEVDLK